MLRVGLLLLAVIALAFAGCTEKKPPHIPDQFIASINDTVKIKKHHCKVKFEAQERLLMDNSKQRWRWDVCAKIPNYHDVNLSLIYLHQDVSLIMDRFNPSSVNFTGLITRKRFAVNSTFQRRRNGVHSKSQNMQNTKEEIR